MSNEKLLKDAKDNLITILELEIKKTREKVNFADFELEYNGYINGLLKAIGIIKLVLSGDAN